MEQSTPPNLQVNTTGVEIVQIPYLSIPGSWVSVLATISENYKVDLRQEFKDKAEALAEKLGTVETLYQSLGAETDAVKKARKRKVAEIRKEHAKRVCQVVSRRYQLRIVVASNEERLYVANYLRNAEPFYRKQDEKFSFASYIFSSIKLEYEFKESGTDNCYKPVKGYTIVMPFANNLTNITFTMMKFKELYLAYDPTLPIPTNILNFAKEPGHTKLSMLPTEDIDYLHYLGKNINHFLNKVKVVPVSWAVLDPKNNIHTHVIKDDLLTHNINREVSSINPDEPTNIFTFGTGLYAYEKFSKNTVLISTTHQTNNMLKKYYGLDYFEENQVVRILKKDWEDAAIEAEEDIEKSEYNATRDVIVGEYAKIVSMTEDTYKCVALNWNDGQLVVGSLKSKKRYNIVATAVDCAQVQPIKWFNSQGLNVAIYLERGEVLKLSDLYKLYRLDCKITVYYVADKLPNGSYTPINVSSQ